MQRVRRLGREAQPQRCTTRRKPHRHSVSANTQRTRKQRQLRRGGGALSKAHASSRSRVSCALIRIIVIFSLLRLARGRWQNDEARVGIEDRGLEAAVAQRSRSGRQSRRAWRRIR